MVIREKRWRGSWAEPFPAEAPSPEAAIAELEDTGESETLVFGWPKLSSSEKVRVRPLPHVPMAISRRALPLNLLFAESFLPLKYLSAF
jgi:hypothetical protein